MEHVSLSQTKGMTMRHRRSKRSRDLPEEARDPLMAVYMDGALAVLFRAMQAWLARGDIKEASRMAATLLRVMPEERPGAAFIDLMRHSHEDDPVAFTAHTEALDERAAAARVISSI